MKLILEETFDVENVVEINESTNQKTYVIKGTFSTPGVKNRNGRIYGKKLWEDNVSKYQNEIKAHTVNTLMEKEHPARTAVNPWDAVAQIRKLEMRENLVYGEAELLNIPETATMRALIDKGIKIGVSSRGVGKMKGDIVEQFNLITYDIVSTPSDYNANLEGFNEAMILEGVDIEINEKGQYICTPESGCGIQVVESTPKSVDKTVKKIAKKYNSTASKSHLGMKDKAMTYYFDYEEDVLNFYKELDKLGYNVEQLGANEFVTVFNESTPKSVDKTVKKIAKKYNSTASKSHLGMKDKAMTYYFDYEEDVLNFYKELDKLGYNVEQLGANEFVTVFNESKKATQTEDTEPLTEEDSQAVKDFFIASTALSGELKRTDKAVFQEFQKHENAIDKLLTKSKLYEDSLTDSTSDLLKTLNNFANKADIETQKQADILLHKKFDAYMGEAKKLDEMNFKAFDKIYNTWYDSTRALSSALKNIDKKAAKQFDSAWGDLEEIILTMDDDLMPESKQINEYTKSSGYEDTDNKINVLLKVLQPDSHLARGISKSLGKGYLKDFKEMGKHMQEIVGIWNEIDMEIDMGESYSSDLTQAEMLLGTMSDSMIQYEGVMKTYNPKGTSKFKKESQKAYDTATDLYETEWGKDY